MLHAVQPVGHHITLRVAHCRGLMAVPMIVAACSGCIDLGLCTHDAGLASNATTSSALWDDTQVAPYFNYEDVHGAHYQVRIDPKATPWLINAHSLRACMRMDRVSNWNSGGVELVPRAVQVWYDDPRSLTPKFRLAAELGLRGVGVWNLDLLDYSAAAAPGTRQQTRDMWDALKAFTA